MPHTPSDAEEKRDIATRAKQLAGSAEQRHREPVPNARDELEKRLRAEMEARIAAEVARVRDELEKRLRADLEVWLRSELDRSFPRGSRT
jgi:hypothetical protein